MNILLAVDGSSHSASAVQAVSTRPWPQGSHVRVLSIVENAGPPPMGDLMVGAGGDLDKLRRQQTEEAKKLTTRVAGSLQVKGLSVETAIREGNPRDNIIEEARHWPADLIVLGSHGYTGIKRLVLGSVAQSVVSHAPCSVEVVRDRAAAEE